MKDSCKAESDAQEVTLALGFLTYLTHLSELTLPESHKRIMIANHPDKGGSPYLATKINEAKDLLEKTASR